MFNYLVDYNPLTKVVSSVLSSSKLLSDLVDYFARIFCPNCPTNLQSMLFASGVLSLTFSALRFFWKQYHTWNWIPAHFQRRKDVNQSYFHDKYGKGYAVITGCTDGIGQAFAEVLAPMFGLILVARNREKLALRVKEFKEINPDVDCIEIIGDLATEEGINSVVEQLRALTRRGLDISIVINNAGTGKAGAFFEIDPKYFTEMVLCNFKSVYAINRQLIPYLRQSNHRTAIINVSSCTGVFIPPSTGIYSSNKHLLDIYTRTLALENRDKMDILSCRPFGVTTKMMGMRKSGGMITPTDCAVSTLADLGKTDTTFSGFNHKVSGSFFNLKTEKEVFQTYASYSKK